MTARLVIYHLVTLARRKTSGASGPALCSKVSASLLSPRFGTALRTDRVRRSGDCGEAAVFRHQEASALRLCAQPFVSPSKPSLAVPGAGEVVRRGEPTHRQQFLCALLEQRSFFAHLVLRCVRAQGGSIPRRAEVVACRARPRPVPGRHPEARQSAATMAQLSEPAETAWPASSFPELEALWADVVGRNLRAAPCPGEG